MGTYRPKLPARKKATQTEDGKLFEIEFRASGDEWKDLLQKVKMLDNVLFFKKSKLWKAPASKKNAKRLLKFGFEIILSSNKSDILTPKVKDYSELYRKEEIDLQEIEGARDYQVDCCKFLSWRGGRGLIGDEAGTGKTVQAISHSKLNRDLWPVLIIVPAIAKEQWKRELGIWAPGASVQILEGKTPWDIPRTDFVIINWEIIFNWVAVKKGENFSYVGKLVQYGFGIVVADEAHYMGNPTSNRTKAVTKLAKKAKHFLPMTGTPIGSKVKQLFPILRLVAPGEFNSRIDFLNRYCDPKPNGFGVSYDGASNIQELHERLAPFMIRRLKRDVMEIQDPRPIIVPLPSKVSQKYKEALRTLKMEMGDLSYLQREERLAELCNTAYLDKRKEVIEWIKDFLNTGEKLLIFTYHRAVIDDLEAEFGKVSVKVDGSVSNTKKQEAIRKFTKDKKTQVFLGNIVSCGTALDGLQHVCSYCVFVEFVGTPYLSEQAIARLYRSGQEKQVTCYHLIGCDSGEEKILEVLDNRSDDFNMILDGKSDRTRLTGLLKEEKRKL